MAIVLYRHNEEACEAVRKLLRSGNRAAVVHPTGTGKSMIAFRLAQLEPERRFLWLSPSEYIVRTQLENVRRADPEGAFGNIRFMTYARLMQLKAEELAGLKADTIVLDEFHRCGAEMWGAGVTRLLQTHAEAKLLGLSATKIRYLDHRRDMVEELFEGRIASEMSLGEAVVRGILPAPKYVTTIYRYRGGLETYEQRIGRMRNRKQRERSEAYLEALRRAMDKAEGLEEVFRRHMTDRAGRYIVFCASVSHMREMHARAAEWFRGVDGAAHCYFVYADNAEAPEAYEAFCRDESEHLKLLFCVNMLNEGIHVTGVSGVILFRPTVSPIIYKQQIGRALTAGSGREPLILDVVNNVEGLYSIGGLQEEMAAAAARLREAGREEEIVREGFRVIDQVQDCRVLFERLEESLHIDWEEYYEAAKSYREEHGDLLVPQRHVTAEGRRLGAWLGTQRSIRGGRKAGRLTREQIERLDALGMVWGDVTEEAWEEHYRQARRYKEEHGHLSIPSGYVDERGFALGKWVARQRQKHQRESELTAEEREQLKRLEELGLCWQGWERQFARNLEAARAYREAHGDLLVPAAYRTAEGVRLGQWIANLRTGAQRLGAEQRRALDELGMVWGSVQEDRWMRWYGAAKRYYQAHGDLAVRKDYVTEDGQALGVWLVNQRACHRRGDRRAMSPLRFRLLDEIGMRW